MRPIERGPAPRVYDDYRDAYVDLCGALGQFCSYCERRIETHLAVEHVQPKSRRKALQTSWTNLLLACANCNSCKGKRAVRLARFVWPDTDNTARAFEYLRTGQVRVMPRTRQPNRSRIESTLTLVGLDRIPGHSKKRKRALSSDIRWRSRQEAFDLASRQVNDLVALDTPIVRQLIVDAAVGRGMFSVWMQAFRSDGDMRRRLIAAFRGTAANCFNPLTGAAMKRPGGCV